MLWHRHLISDESDSFLHIASESLSEWTLEEFRSRRSIKTLHSDTLDVLWLDPGGYILNSIPPYFFTIQQASFTLKPEHLLKVCENMQEAYIDPAVLAARVVNGKSIVTMEKELLNQVYDHLISNDELQNSCALALEDMKNSYVISPIKVPEA